MVKTKQVNEFIYPTRVVEASSNVTNAEFLLKTKYLAHTLAAGEHTSLPHGGYIVLDFGKEYSGGVRILTHHVTSPNNSLSLRIRFGESLGEVMHDVGYMGTTNDHNHRDFIYNVPSLSDVTVGNSGFRFVRIDNVSDYDATLRAVVLCYVHMDAPQVGYFRCDDERLNQIYDIATRTAFMTVQNGFLIEAIKRDRLVWAGDMNVQVHTLLDNYGDLDAIRESIMFFKDSYPLPGWMNDIPSYTLWWIMYVEATYQVNGDEEFLKQVLPYIKGLVLQLDKCITDDGSVNFYNANCAIAMDYFIDWPNWQKDGNELACVAMTKLALESADRLLKGDKVAQEAIKRIKHVEMSPLASKGLRSLQEEAFGEEHLECLLQDGYKTTSTFMSYNIYKTMAKFGHTNEAVKIMKDFYGLMLDLGATTFFEDYQDNWVGGSITDFPGDDKPYFHANYGQFCYEGYRLSLCHGWSSGPSPFLIEEVAGIQVIDSKTYKIKPVLGDLKFVEAARYTKYGPLSVSIKKLESGELDIKYTAPKEIKVIVQ